MLKFIRGKGQQPSAERQRLQKDLFAYRKTAQHGFPHKPSALAYDPVSKLMAIGTQTGAIKIFGQPGVELYGQHTLVNNSASELNVQLLEWVYGTGRILSLTAANQLILWEPFETTLLPIKTLHFDGKLKKVSSLCCSLSKDLLWIGTEGGNIYQLDLHSFTIKEPVIYHDVVLEQVPPAYKLNPGAIESIRQLPNALNKLLIAYNRGLCVLWDFETSSVERAYIAPGHGQSVGLSVNFGGSEFSWYHADGSYATWSIDNAEPPSNVNYVPYGPDPCKSINRLYKGKHGNNDVIVFSGGMPRSAYGDHNCVSVHVNNGKKVCLDFTSKVIDFFVTYKDNSDVAEVLIVLLEEELCAYDLNDPNISAIKAPYLHSVHASAVTCNYLASQVKQSVYENILRAGDEQDIDYSNIDWPITGGALPDDSGESDEEDTTKLYEILLTGHEDGSVKFWDCTGVLLKPIYNFKTGSVFGSEHDFRDDAAADISAEQLDEGEPPFRKAGLFDPYSDDPRLAVKKIALCPKTGQLIVGGTAGQIVIADFNDAPEKVPLKYCSMNLVSDRDGFVWKGHDQLNVRAKLLESDASPITVNGVNITGVLQVLPPASITCMALEANWGLVSGGTAHGLVLFDFRNFVPVFHRCTLNPNDLTGAGEQLSRRKSFKKSLRESFRKLRKGRSTRNNPSNQVPTTLEARPVERQIEARCADDGLGSMVRCLLFAKTYVTNVNITSPTLWSATNASTVSVFLLHLPPAQTAATSVPSASGNAPPQTPRRISAQLAKEIQLKHRAPVVGISIFDQAGSPVDQLNDGENGSPPHRLLIASEEQFKVFSLPQLKPINKYKLTAHEGARIRRIHFGSFRCRIPPELLQSLHGGSPTKSTRSHVDGDGSANISANPAAGRGDEYHEIALICLTNMGDIMVLSVPELKRQLNAAAVRREDINGISSLGFTNSGEALYMMSSSELQRIALATSKVVQPTGIVEVEPLETEESALEENEEKSNKETDENAEVSNSLEVTEPPTASIRAKLVEGNVERSSLNLTNGISNSNSPNRGNDTISSSIGDITVDSVRDHLNLTTTTLCSTTTEETVGRLSVLSTQTNKATTTVNMDEIPDINISNLGDLALKSNTTETSTSSVVIKSVITSISHEKTNGESELRTPKTTTPEESQF
ncbi:lethal(2) giant larvae protein isoform X1 [Drosophila elegans]|uniref:lethal(2) giant larvae protein isoform X1 n=1 Tax=Drosophila elegans TaxID=30023 RepID=UPI0007E76307|nr:lethal(2) giant larvae protein isoform X1 [Drosophila elegans]XP_017110996.1 lethal(2) giant larvae protein isoform X1 [Drosophila elegans]XP_017110998.1 lethal(2) giant larvae protein isoform X1 [Drosophila elegans]XP_017110999.1 lethal(2) giant larvae protein isoform X1 [Drosophila elegans]